jgi:hypothetical protein
LKLHPQQQYVFEHAQQLAITPKLVTHPYATRSCAEKLRLLQGTFPDKGWYLGRVVKALFAAVDDDTVCFVMPETGRKLTQDLASHVYARLDLPTEEAYLTVDRMYVPESMEPGTCTPFVPEHEMKLVDYIFIEDFPELTDIVVDISIGGVGKVARRTSMTLPYRSIFDILKRQFDGKVHKSSFG